MERFVALKSRLLIQFQNKAALPPDRLERERLSAPGLLYPKTILVLTEADSLAVRPEKLSSGLTLPM